MSIGLNMNNMFKLIKTMNNSDILTLFLKTNSPNHLGIQINNNEKNTQTIYNLNLLDINDEKLKFHPQRLKLN